MNKKENWSQLFSDNEGEFNGKFKILLSSKVIRKQQSMMWSLI